MCITDKMEKTTVQEILRGGYAKAYEAGAYRNREYAEAGVTVKGKISRALQDLFYDPQTSGSLLIAVPEAAAPVLLRELQDNIPAAEQIGYVTDVTENSILLERYRSVKAD